MTVSHTMGRKTAPVVSVRTSLFRFAICILFTGCAVYSYLQEQNRVTELKMQVPKMVKEIEALHHENRELQYQVMQFESPAHLLHLAQLPEHNDLRFPLDRDVLAPPSGLAMTRP